MFETAADSADEASLVGLRAARELLEACAPAVGTTVMVEQIRVLEELKALAAAAQAAVTATFVAARRAEQIAAGVAKRLVGRGIAQEVGLARRESPFRAGRYAGFATFLTRELPQTLAAWRAGVTTEWRAMLVARETGWLCAEDRAAVDAELGPRLGSLGDRQTEAEAARLAYTRDPHGKIRAIERAAGGRHVSLRPAPDGQCRLNATLPLAQGVAAYAELCREADAARAAGDECGRGQVMADTLVERITGQSSADAVPLTVNLVMTEETLFSTGNRADEPATVAGFGPVPAPFARALVTRTAQRSDAAVRIRRLFPDRSGRLVTMETASRDFTPAMAEFVKLRDQWCTTPFCGAPIRHIDHILAWIDGGATSLGNAGGTCESCNYAKEAPGWRASPQPDGAVLITTPTGHERSTFARVRAPVGQGPPSARPPGRTDTGARPRSRARPLSPSPP